MSPRILPGEICLDLLEIAIGLLITDIIENEPTFHILSLHIKQDGMYLGCSCTPEILVSELKEKVHLNDPLDFLI